MQHFSFVMNAINCETVECLHPVTLMIIATKVYLNGGNGCVSVLCVFTCISSVFLKQYVHTRSPLKHLNVHFAHFVE